MKAGLRLVVGLALVCASVVSAVPAGAAQSWKVVGTAAGAAYGHLAAVACPSPSTCFAVGTQDGPNVSARMIQRWNGSRWLVMTLPNPRGAIRSQLLGVQCVTTTSCFAVGQYDTARATNTLVMRWDGVRWSIVASPNAPGNVVSGLSGVQCTSSTSCFAVGGSFMSTPTSSAEQTLIEKWNGAAWTIVPSPNPVVAADSVLAGVTCTSPTACFAVGNYDTELLTKTLIEQWDGTAWSIVDSPNQNNSTFSSLLSISCPSATSCFAVGSGHGTLVERWNGTAWSIVTSANPTGATGLSLTSVSCPSIARCFAVGDIFRKTIVQRLVEQWGGKRWSLVTVPVPSGTKLSNLSGVSCASTASCFAVGDYRLGPSRRPLLERYS